MADINLIDLANQTQGNLPESRITGLVADLAAKATIVGVQNESYTYATDMGTADAYAVTLSPVPTLVVGLLVHFIVAHTNTTTSTINVNSLGVKTIKKRDGATNLVAGDLVAGQLISIVYDGTNFQMQSSPATAGGGSGDVTGPGSAVDSDFAQFNGTTGKVIKDGGISLDTDGTLAANSDLRIASQKAGKTYADTKATKVGVQLSSYTYAADTGAANAYVVTLAPVPTLTAGLIVTFKTSNANSAASTLNVNSLGAVAIKKMDGVTALISGDIAAGQIVTVVYDGTNFQMGSPVANTFAPLNSPTFTGTPAAPTPSLTDNSTRLATTAFVQAFTPGGGGAAASLSPDTPPVSAGTLDDEFTGASLDLVRWTWFNQGSATATEGSGYLALKTTSSTDITNGIYQTAPATPWEVTTKMIMPTVFNSITSMAFGIMIADATKECQIGWRPNSPSTLFFNYPGTGSFASSQTIVGYNWTAAGGSFPYVYWRVRDNGTNIIVSMSVDGLIWTQMASNSRTAYLPAGPTRVGLFIDGNGNSSATFASYGVFDWFRRTL